MLSVEIRVAAHFNVSVEQHVSNHSGHSYTLFLTDVHIRHNVRDADVPRGCARAVPRHAACFAHFGTRPVRAVQATGGVAITDANMYTAGERACVRAVALFTIAAQPEQKIAPAVI